MTTFIKKHQKGILGTIAFHGVLVLLFIFSGFSTPLPLPAEQGILVNFGDIQDAAGSAEVQQSVAREEPTQTESQPVQQEQEETPRQEKQPDQEQEIAEEGEDIETQDFEEAPVVDKKEEKKQETQEQQQEEQTEEQQQEKQQEQKKEEPAQEVNERALYSGKSTDESGESEGRTEGAGNQGSQTGSPLSDNYADVDSQGMGGVDFSLEGRNPESLPKPEYNYQVEGKVVVEITVDKYGNVTNVTSGVKGSTTLDTKLLEAAKKAARNAKFDRKPDAPAYQKGTITYYFKLQ